MSACDGRVCRGRTRLRLSDRDGGLGVQLFGDRSRHVRRLELTDSGLGSLPDSLFGGLSSARLLRLDSNRLSSVPVAALARLPRLQTLAINSNRIAGLLRGQLDVVPCLRHLSLAENGLRHLEPGALPAGLRQLGLRDNQLHTLNGSVRWVRTGQPVSKHHW